SESRYPGVRCTDATRPFSYRSRLGVDLRDCLGPGSVQQPDRLVVRSNGAGRFAEGLERFRDPVSLHVEPFELVVEGIAEPDASSVGGRQYLGRAEEVPGARRPGPLNLVRVRID